MGDAENLKTTIYLPPAADAVLRSLAQERGATRSGILRQALGLLQAAHSAAKDGSYIGTSRDREALDTVIIAP